MKELILLFFRLGCTAFGGPAAHIAMMEDEVVERRGWLSRQRFLDLVGATNLIPGPNSTEMALHIGYDRAGWRGMLASGAAFIVPAAVITGALGWLYVRFGSLPDVEPWVVGIEAAVLAVLLSAVWRLSRKAVKGWRLFLIGAAVTASALYGWNPILVLFGGGILGALWLRFTAPRATAAFGLPLATVQAVPEVSAAVADPATAGPTLTALGLLFLKIGSVLYGSGYVLIAFLQESVVERYAWITQAQLLDVVALGQLTPGPVLTTATVIGYMTCGVPGAVVATVAIFLPSFVFVAILNPLIPKLRKSVWMSAFLDAVNVSAVGLMVAVLVQLGRGALEEWLPRLILALALFAILRFRVGSPWVVLGGALLGGAGAYFGG